jgi:hypothetical protein
MARSVGFDWWRSGMLTRLYEWSLERGREEAERFGHDALEVAHRIGDRQHRIYLLALHARSAATDSDSVAQTCSGVQSRQRNGGG